MKERHSFTLGVDAARFAENEAHFDNGSARTNQRPHTPFQVFSTGREKELGNTVTLIGNAEHRDMLSTLDAASSGSLRTWHSAIGIR